MISKARIWFCLAIAIGAIAHAKAVLAETGFLPYDEQSAIFVGMGIDPEITDIARSPCLAYEAEAMEWIDTEGAVATKFSVEVVSNYESLAKTLHFGLDYSSLGSVSAEVLSGSVEHSLKLKRDEFAKEEERTLNLIVKAESSYGRRGLRQYSLKPEYSQLIAEKKYDEFRSSCGTHTVIAEQRTSVVAIVITIRNLNKASKESIESNLVQKMSGGAKIEAVNAKVESNLSVTWNRIIDQARALGTLSATFESKGGKGIPNAVQVAIISNPQDIDKILENLSEIAKDFTKENSAPTGYVAVSNDAFGLRTAPANIDKIAKLQTLYIKLAHINGNIARIEKYQADFPKIFDQHYAGVLETTKSLRQLLVTKIKECVEGGSCIPPAAIDKPILFLEDLIPAPELRLSCNYSAYRITNQRGGFDLLEVLNSISVNLQARVRHAAFVSIDNALIRKIRPNGDPFDVTPRFTQFARSDTSSDGSMRIFGTLDYLIFDLRDFISISGDSVTLSNVDGIVAKLEEFKNTLYSLDLQAENGLSLPQPLGFPFANTCVAYRTNVR